MHKNTIFTPLCPTRSTERGKIRSIFNQETNCFSCQSKNINIEFCNNLSPEGFRHKTGLYPENRI